MREAADILEDWLEYKKLAVGSKAAKALLKKLQKQHEDFDEALIDAAERLIKKGRARNGLMIWVKVEGHLSLI